MYYINVLCIIYIIYVIYYVIYIHSIYKEEEMTYSTFA